MKTLTKVLLILLVSYFVAAANGASFEVFLKIDGIEGDSTDPWRLNEIDVQSFKIGVLNTPPLDGGGGAGKAAFTDLTVFKFIDKASPQLYLAAAKGEHFKSATLSVRKLQPNQNPFIFYKIVLDNVIISSVNDNASTTDQNGQLLESVTLNWTRITWTVVSQNGEVVTHWWDRTTAQGQ